MADKSIKILLADDSAFMRKVLMDILKEAGYSNFVECEDGNDCLSKFNSEKPDLLLLDVIMPNKSGLEVLKELGAGANAIMVSAVGQDQMIAEAKQGGAKDYIVKPFKREEVIAIVDRVVSGI